MIMAMKGDKIECNCTGGVPHEIGCCFDNYELGPWMCVIEVAPETTGDPEPARPRTNGEAFDPPTYLDLCRKVSELASEAARWRQKHAELLGAHQALEALVHAGDNAKAALRAEVERLRKQVNESDANAIRYRNELVDYRTRVRLAVQ